MPASDVPAVCIPWYARSRRIRHGAPGSPESDQYRRTIFVAVSIESEPPLVKNTLESATGASAATARRARASEGS